MTIREWLTLTAGILESSSDTPALDAELLLADELVKSRSWLFAHDDEEISADKQNNLELKVERRRANEPLAYIREKVEFFGRKYSINNHVLVPRPESEALIELGTKLSKDIVAAGQIKIADIGSGSGVLGITLALELGGDTRPDFYDVDGNTLILAEKNAQLYGVRGKYIQSDLLEAIAVPYDIILANLPYVPNDFPINLAAKNEPTLALYGGADGLDLYRRMFDQLKSFDWIPQLVLVETLPFQHRDLEKIALSSGFKLIETIDLAQAYSPKG